MTYCQMYADFRFCIAVAFKGKGGTCPLFCSSSSLCPILIDSSPPDILHWFLRRRNASRTAYAFLHRSSIHGAHPSHLRFPHAIEPVKRI
jgi:hypothetical protein